MDFLRQEGPLAVQSPPTTILSREERMAASKTFRCGESRFQDILRELQSLGARVEGSEQAGTLAGETILGRFEASYSHDGDELTVTVTRKPSLVTDSFLQERLDKLAHKYGAE
jgi:hypothetical protein